MSSYESISATLSEDNWSLHGNGKPNNCETDHLSGAHNCSGSNVFAERNYPCDSHIVAYFGYNEASFSEIGEAAFQKQLYLCLISQTLWMKGEIERRRSRNSFGNLVSFLAGHETMLSMLLGRFFYDYQYKISFMRPSPASSSSLDLATERKLADRGLGAY